MTRSAWSGAPAATVRLVPAARTVNDPSVSASCHVVGRATCAHWSWQASIAATSQREREATSVGRRAMLWVPHSTQRPQDRLQLAAVSGQLVDRGALRARQQPPADHRRSLQVLQARSQRVGADAWQALAELTKPQRAEQQIPHFMQGPAPTETSRAVAMPHSWA